MCKKYFMSNIKPIMAISKYVKMSPTKIRRILNQIRGHSCNDILAILKFLPYKAKFPICKVINSAINNAQNNFNIDKKKLFITEAYANEGPKLKRIKFCSKGNTSVIKKKTCHIIIKVDQKVN